MNLSNVDNFSSEKNLGTLGCWVRSKSGFAAPLCLSVSLCLSLSFSLSVSLSLSLYIYMSLCLSISPSVSLSLSNEMIFLKWFASGFKNLRTRTTLATFQLANEKELFSHLRRISDGFQEVHRTGFSIVGQDQGAPFHVHPDGVLRQADSPFGHRRRPLQDHR